MSESKANSQASQNSPKGQYVTWCRPIEEIIEDLALGDTFSPFLGREGRYGEIKIYGVGESLPLYGKRKSDFYFVELPKEGWKELASVWKRVLKAAKKRRREVLHEVTWGLRVAP